MTLVAWLEYLETLNPHKIQLGLERVAKIADRLHLRHFHCPVVTISGTNGKGSAVAFLEQITLAGGYRVGAYTSPHLFKFNERIRVLGHWVEDAELCAAFELIYQASKDIPLTYFEFTTLAALSIFQHAQLDILILEVGLGGRLDAVNVVDADITLITTIAIDHTDWLGETREAIGREKAGIFRANKPAVCGDLAVPVTVIDYAGSLNVDLYSLGADYHYVVKSNNWTWSSRLVTWVDLPIVHLEIQNAAAVLMVVQLLQFQLPLSRVAIEQGLKCASLPGRFQQVTEPVNHIFDVAHNPAAGKWLAQRLNNEAFAGKTFAIVGMLADKDARGTLEPLLPQITAWFVGALPTSRTAPSEQICNTLWELGAKECYNFSSIVDAYHAALAQCGKQDRLLIFGSFYTVSTVWSAQRCS